MIILDTSFIISYFNERDENHLASIELMKELADLKFGPLHITDYIFDEVVTVSFVRLKNLRKAVEIGNHLLRALKILEVEKSDFDRAWNLFRKQKDTDFSFTDCTTLSIMHENEIGNIATFDEDFLTIKSINAIGLT